MSARRVGMLRVVPPFASLVAVLTVGFRASAATPAFRVRYITAEGCPSAEAFTREILARTSLAHAASGVERAVRFQVRLSTADDKSRGELAIQDIDGSVSVRSVDGSSCGDVVSALALIAALTMDPDASTEPHSAEKALPPAAPQSATSAAEPSRTAARGEERFRAFPTTALPSERAVPIVPTRAPRRINFTNGAHLGLDGGIAPSTLVSGSLFVEALANDSAPLGWAARLSFLYAPTVTVPAGPGDASFQWSAIRAEGCPLRFATGDGAFSVYPCAGLEAGRTHAIGIPSGAEITHPETQDALWLSALVLARIRLELARVVLIEIEAGPVFPVNREHFVFESPHHPIYDVPSVGALASLGVGLHFR